MSDIFKVMTVSSGRADYNPLWTLVGLCLENPYIELKHIHIGEPALTVAMDWADINIAKFEPDVVILLGDRYETLIAATAATYHRRTIAHIHGGEVTVGSFDNRIRHAITQLAHIHFCAHEQAKNFVVLGMKRPGDTVYVVGAPGLDHVAYIMAEEEPYLTNEILLTWHPPTAEQDTLKGLEETLAALAPMADRYRILWTGTNQDPGSEEIRAYMEVAPPWVEDIEVQRSDPSPYLRRVRAAALVIGNSSSSIIEVPSLHTPSVDVGTRQQGRLRSDSVFHATEDEESIRGAITKALAYRGKFYNPYYRKNSSGNILQILLETDLAEVRRKP